MSVENVRKNMKSLLIIALVFVGIAAMGPLVFYGLPALFAFLRDVNPWLALIVIPALLVGWTVISYLTGWRFDMRTSRDSVEIKKNG